MRWNFAEITDADRKHGTEIVKNDHYWRSREFPYFVLFDPQNNVVMTSLYQSAVRSSRNRLRATKEKKGYKIVKVEATGAETVL